MKARIKAILPPILLQAWRRIRGTDPDLALPHSERAKKWGHRAYIGGANAQLWYGIGKRQYHFLISRGLQSHHHFLDVACGSLRLGQYLIPMLNTGHYYGLEGEKSLVDAGLEREILFDIAKLKIPKFSYNYDFDLDFCDGYDFAIAQSLFTHLNIDDITKCFVALSYKANRNSQFFFTFFEGDEKENKMILSHPHKNWFYQYKTLEKIAQKHGFTCDYIGDWGHERHQMMAVARK